LSYEVRLVGGETPRIPPADELRLIGHEVVFLLQGLIVARFPRRQLYLVTLNQTPELI
jgi:hypothetical protein